MREPCSRLQRRRYDAGVLPPKRAKNNRNLATPAQRLQCWPVGTKETNLLNVGRIYLKPRRREKLDWFLSGDWFACGEGEEPSEKPQI
jgi:hypothetical protein